MSSIPAVINDGEVTISDDGGNAATLLNASGDFSASAITPDGQEVILIDSRGNYVGDRLGPRVPVTGSFSVFASDPGDTFAKLSAGKTAGFVSTTAAIGDVKRVDLVFDYGYGAEVRKLTLDDAHLTRDLSEGNPSTFTYNFTAIGTVATVNDAGTITIRSGL